MDVTNGSAHSVKQKYLNVCPNTLMSHECYDYPIEKFIEEFGFNILELAEKLNDDELAKELTKRTGFKWKPGYSEQPHPSIKQLLQYKFGLFMPPKGSKERRKILGGKSFRMDEKASSTDDE